MSGKSSGPPAFMVARAGIGSDREALIVRPGYSCRGAVQPSCGGEASELTRGQGYPGGQFHMKSSYLTAAALAALAFQAPAHAQRTPSDHVRCDGRPDNVSAGETAARLLGAVTLLGIFAPPPEQPDDSQRLAGAEGVAICNAALDGESNEVRRAQLILATAIHQIEAGDYDAALAEALRVESDRPTLSGSPAFRHSLGLAAMEVQAMALLGAGRLEEARDKAFAMAAA